MSTKIDQKSYLKKYLGGSSGEKKKKKKKAVKGKGLKIIDDDLDLSKLRALEGDELDIFDEGEDAPQIAGIIDDRPEELKQLEQLKTSSKWKVINQDDGFNSKIQIEEIKKDIKEEEKENELIFGKMYSDSEDEKKNDSDVSPPRKGANRNERQSPPRKGANRNERQSPPRKGANRNERQSPPRKGANRNERDSPPRKGANRNERHSPPRKGANRNERHSPPRKGANKNERHCPPRKEPNRNEKHSNLSRRESGSDCSPPRKREKPRNNGDSDASPPRPNKPKERIRKPSRWGDFDIENNSYRQENSNKHRNSDSDVSPPRKQRRSSPSPIRKVRRNSQDSDQSPPRRGKSKRNSLSPVRKVRHTSSDSDQSPPRRDKNRHMSDRDNRKRNNDSPPPSNKKMAKTLDGKLAGLQDARQLRQENSDFRKREEEIYNKMSDEVSGRNAKAVRRKDHRETAEKKQKQKEKTERQKEIDEKYKKWSRGLKQLEDQEARVQEFMHEASKPLARHKGDRDLENNLKQIERDGDPMLQYIRNRKREAGELGPEKPSYKGQFPPNRFNIRPGYRWDGVDRSNGYEKKFFEQQSKKKAQEEEAYKWSTEDL